MATVSITKPTVNGSSGTWGTILNTALDDIVTGVNARVDPATATTKGDLLAASGTGVLARQAVGANSQVLTADSAQANGVKWAYPTVPVVADYASLPTGATGMRARTTDTGTTWEYTTSGGTGIWVPVVGTMVLGVHQTTGRSIANNAWTAIIMDSVLSTGQNPYATWSSGTNPARFTAPWPGWYELSGGVGFDSAAAGYRSAGFLKNAGATPIAESICTTYSNAVAAAAPNPRTITISLVATDYIQLAGFQTSGGAILSTASSSVMNVKYLGLNGLQ